MSATTVKLSTDHWLLKNLYFWLDEGNGALVEMDQRRPFLWDDIQDVFVIMLNTSST